MKHSFYQRNSHVLFHCEKSLNGFFLECKLQSNSFNRIACENKTHLNKYSKLIAEIRYFLRQISNKPFFFNYIMKIWYQEPHIWEYKSQNVQIFMLNFFIQREMQKFVMRFSISAFRPVCINVNNFLLYQWQEK